MKSGCEDQKEVAMLKHVVALQKQVIEQSIKDKSLLVSTIKEKNKEEIEQYRGELMRLSQALKEEREERQVLQSAQERLLEKVVELLPDSVVYSSNLIELNTNASETFNEESLNEASVIQSINTDTQNENFPRMKHGACTVCGAVLDGEPHCLSCGSKVSTS